MNKEKCQAENNFKQEEILKDISSTGKERPWRKKKIANMILANSYDEINENKASRLRECATLLQFAKRLDNSLKLHKTNFCRVRLCPVCGWRRSLKIYDHTNKIMMAIENQKEYKYIFLNLTIRNCKSDELDTAINDMMDAWNRLLGYKDVRQAVKGWYRGMEITHDVNMFITEDMYYANAERQKYYDKHGLAIGDKNPMYDSYHPHFHTVLIVNNSYFSSREYLKKDDWALLWKKAMRLDYEPVVYVRKVKGNTAKAVAEIAKYTVKDDDLIIPEDWDLTVDTVRLLDKVLDKRRLVAYGGLMKEWHKKLNLDDEVDGDLTNIDDESVSDGVDKELIYFAWNVGYRQYIKVKQ